MNLTLRRYGLLIVRRNVRAGKCRQVLPSAWLLTAQALSEYQRDDGRVRLVLQALMKRYPGHEVIPQAQRYAQSLARLAQRAPAAATVK